MTWSFLSRVHPVFTTQEAQRNEPGINQIDNCGPACISVLMQLHGYPDIEPQDLVGAGYKGGTTGPQLNAIVAQRYPNPPAMAYGPSVDPIGDLAGWAAQGFLAMGLVWSDGAAVVKPYNTGIGHWIIPVEDDGSGLTFWNSEWSSFDRITYADFLKASWHEFDVCQRPITQEDHVLKIITADGAKGNYITNGIVKWWLPSPAAEGGPPDHLGGARDLFPEIPPTIKVDKAYFDAIPELGGSAVAPSYQGSITLTPK